METKTEATIEDLYLISGKAELVNGEIAPMSPTSGWHNRASFVITTSLYQYEMSTGRGSALGDNVGFVVDLPNRKSFSPDAAFHADELSDSFMQGAPLFAVEVRSESDYGQQAERIIANKRRDYCAAGTLVYWDVDLLGEKVVRVYRASDPENPTLYGRGDMAEAEPALPGWTMPVDDIFPRRQLGA